VYHILYIPPSPHPSLSRKVSSLSICGLSQLVTRSRKYFPTFQQLVTPLPLGGGWGGGLSLHIIYFSAVQYSFPLPPPPLGRSGRGGEGVLGGGDEEVFYKYIQNIPIYHDQFLENFPGVT
jgi:hypothetical protein